VRMRLVNAARDLGGLDLLVNNASELGAIGPLLQFDVQRFGRVFPVNVGAPIAPQALTPEGLQQTVGELRGDWR